MNNRRPPPNEQVKPAEQPLLIVDSQHLDFGEVWAASRFHWQVSLTNPTQEPITLKQLSGDCACVAIGAIPPQLQPGETVPVSLTLDLTHSEPRESTSWVHPYQHRLTAVAVMDGNVREFNWTIQGRVKQAIRPAGSSLQFDTVSVREVGIERSLKLAAAECVDHIECDARPNWSVQVNRVQSASGEFVVVVRPREPLQPRPVSDVIRLTPFGSSGNALPERKVTLVGEFVRDILPAPRAVYFGALEGGRGAEEDLRLRSLTNRHFHVTAITCEPPDAGIAVAPRGTAEAEARYAVQVQTPQEGERTAEITFRVEEVDGTRYALVVPVRYHGRSATHQP
jgi:hypothetical protein